MLLSFKWLSWICVRHSDLLYSHSDFTYPVTLLIQWPTLLTQWLTLPIQWLTLPTQWLTLLTQWHSGGCLFVIRLVTETIIIITHTPQQLMLREAQLPTERCPPSCHEKVENHRHSDIAQQVSALFILFFPTLSAVCLLLKFVPISPKLDSWA